MKAPPPNSSGPNMTGRLAFGETPLCRKTSRKYGLCMELSYVADSAEVESAYDREGSTMASHTIQHSVCERDVLTIDLAC